MVALALVFRLITLSALAASDPNLPEKPATPEPPGLTRRIVSPAFQPPDPKRIKVAFFDADSTLRVSRVGAVSATSPTDVQLLPYMVEKLKEYIDQGYLLAIVSNQGGIAAGAVSWETADGALNHTRELLAAEGVTFHYHDFAEANNLDRKPYGTMGHRLEEKLRERFGADAAIDKEASFMVGDSAYTPKQFRQNPKDPSLPGEPGTHFSSADRGFAESYGVKFHEPFDFFGWRPHGKGDNVFRTLEEVQNYLKTHPKPGCSGSVVLRAIQ